MSKESYDLYMLGFISKAEYELGSRNYEGCTSCSYTPCGVGIQRLVELVKPTPVQPEPPYTEMLIGTVDGDMLGVMMGRVTQGKVYEIVEDLGWLYKIVDDRGIHGDYHYSWFTNVKLYDEDETQLTCRDIEFNVEDYIDLRKHTPDQIRHIAKFYPVYTLEEVLADGEDWGYLVFGGEEFYLCGGAWKGDYTFDGEEYTFDDIFYLEE